MKVNTISEDMKLFALCNMLYNGRAFCVVRKPDWNGGWYHDIEHSRYRCKQYEYIEWSGTPIEFARQRPSFTTHLEPFHEKPVDYTYTAQYMVEWEINHRNR